MKSEFDKSQIFKNVGTRKEHEIKKSLYLKAFPIENLNFFC